jgi:hypothetical protein
MARLVNVRLDEQYLRKAAKLRAEGVALSDLVREAIDTKYDQVIRCRRNSDDAGAVLARIFEQWPDPPDLEPVEYNVHERKEARAAILKKLRSRKR